MKSLKKQTAKGLFWGGFGNGIQQLLNLVFGIFLARMLSQSDYGMVGMLTIFSQIANTLQEGGFTSALNRKENVTQKDYNAVLWMSTFVSLCLYVALFFCAPLIADFYGVQELIPLSRYFFVVFIISSLGTAPRAFLFRNMMVRESAIISMMCILVSGVVGISMAACGFSYWGIATQTLIYTFTSTIMSFYFSKWLPSIIIDFSPIKDMLGFSSKLIITNVCVIINSNVFSVLLGKIYTPKDVGNYTQANKWNFMGWSFVSNMLNGIAQPVFTKTEGDVGRQKIIFRKLLRFTAFVCFPTMFGLALISKEFIVILLTEKWIESARMMQMLCIAGAFFPISSLFSNLIISRGKSNVYMWCSIALCLSQLATLSLFAVYGIDRMINAYVVLNICWLFVWYIFARSEVKICLREVVLDISPYLVISALLTFIAFIITNDIESLYLAIVTKIIFVGGAYCLILWLLKSRIFKETILFLVKREILFH